MLMARIVLGATFVVGSVSWTNAQQSVTVQLPTFSFFSVQTTVVVPDSGAGIRARMRLPRRPPLRYGRRPRLGGRPVGGVVKHAAHPATVVAQHAAARRGGVSSTGQPTDLSTAIAPGGHRTASLGSGMGVEDLRRYVLAEGDAARALLVARRVKRTAARPKTGNANATATETGNSRKDSRPLK